MRQKLHALAAACVRRRFLLCCAETSPSPSASFSPSSSPGFDSESRCDSRFGAMLIHKSMILRAITGRMTSIVVYGGDATQKNYQECLKVRCEGHVDVASSVVSVQPLLPAHHETEVSLLLANTRHQKTHQQATAMTAITTPARTRTARTKQEGEGAARTSAIAYPTSVQQTASAMGPSHCPIITHRLTDGRPPPKQKLIIIIIIITQ